MPVWADSRVDFPDVEKRLDCGARRLCRDVVRLHRHDNLRAIHDYIEGIGEVSTARRRTVVNAFLKVEPVMERDNVRIIHCG